MKYLFTIIQVQFIVTLACYGTFGQVQTEEYEPDENTVLLLHLNETSGNIAYDESQYQNHGTINGNQPSEGKFFGGRTYPNNNTDLGITLPYTSSLNIVGGDPITMESWIKTDIYFEGATNIIKLDEYVLSLGSFGSKGHLQILRRDGNNWNICEVNNLIPLNEWVHVMASYDGNNTKMYINGIEQEYTVFINAYFQVDTIRIASFKGSIVPVNANVLIDEVRISDVARDNDLVAYYPFNGNANDESGNGNDGIVIGAVLTNDRFENINSAYYFDGIDDEIILGSEPFNFTNHSYAISVWAKWDIASNSGTHIFDKQGYPVNGGGGYRLYTGATGEIIFAISTEVFGSGFVEYNTHIIPNLDTWYHLVANVDVTGSTTVYINSEAKVMDLTEPLIGNAFELKLGRRIDFNGSRFKGIIDDVRIYNRELSQSEIDELYHEGGWTGGNGLVAYYPFNGNANDESGNGYHGTLLGNATTDGTLLLGNNDLDALSLPNSVVNGLNDFTISSILKINTLHTSGGPGNPWNSWVSCANSFTDTELFIAYSANMDKWSIGINAEAFFNNDATIEDNQFHHFVVTRNGSVARLYVNGLEIGNGVAVQSNALNVDLGGFIIGQDQDAVGGSFQTHQSWAGEIDNLRIYDYALTDEEVLDLYNEETNQLVAYYPFNGNANDESGNGYDGIVSGATLTNDRFENPNSAYDFDGNDFIDVPNGVNFEFDTEMTAALFMYVENVPTTGVHFLISNWSPGNIPGAGDAGFAISINVGDLVFIVAWLSNAWEAVHIPMSEIPINEWFHIAGVRDANELRFYLNGVLIAVDPVTAPSIYNPHQLVRMGSQPSSGSSPYTGKMDQVRIYDRALSESEILELYHEGGGGTNNTISVLSPNGGEVWGMGTEQSITWSSKDIIDVKIEFSSNNGATWNLVTESTPSTGIYLWTVPAIHTIQALVKITDVADEENNDPSDDPFTIEPVTSADIFNSTIPEQFELMQNYPNPFNPVTTIYYGLPNESSVRILIFDILGSNVMRFTKDNQPAGYHTIKFDATALPSGIYFYQIQASGFNRTKKMILLK